MHAYLRTYSIHSTASSLLMQIFGWNKVICLLMHVLHRYCVINDVRF